MRITNSDIRHIINEACRKLSLLNETMEEGGKAGHMSHPYDVNTFTFGDYKQLVVDLFRTGIERYTEKLDGMNIFATVSNDGSVRFARNAGDVKNPEGGMNPQGMGERWGIQGKDPTILGAYTNAYKLFGDVVKNLKDPVAFFNGNGYRIYANCEVIDQEHPNVIPYPEKVLSFHGLAAFSTDGTGKEVELPDSVFDEKMQILAKLMPEVKSEYGKPQITPEVVIDIREGNEETIEKYVAYIDRIEKMAGVTDETTIIDYRAKLLPGWLEEHGYGAILNNKFTNYFMRRWVYDEKNPSIRAVGNEMRKSGIENAESVFNLAREIEGFGKFRKTDPINVAFDEIMEPVQMFFYRLGNEVISRCRGYANTGREETVIETVKKLLESTKLLVAQSGSLAAEKEMTYWLQKLSEVDYTYNALEGVVFNYKGNTFKLTGSFAALNRAINIRFGLGK